MTVAIITGSGTNALPGFGEAVAETVQTPYGSVEVTRGALRGIDALHVSRHGPGHARLSSGVTHRANVWALRELGADAVIGCSVCGAADPQVTLGSLIVFDDLHFIGNRLPDGSLCTFFDQAGGPARGHWILHGGPFSDEVRAALVAACEEVGVAARADGTYGHVDGPRFNTPSEITSLRAAGVTAVSQTGGPETVLCGELELPYALLGFATDYANEVTPGEPTPIETLTELMGRSTGVFDAVVTAAARRLDGTRPAPGGTMFRFGS